MNVKEQDADNEGIAAWHRIESCECVVTRTYENGTCNKCGMQDMGDCESIYSIPKSVRQAILNLEMHL